jgi:hypothetical protein
MNRINSKKLAIGMSLLTATLFSTVANATVANAPGVSLTTALQNPGVYKQLNYYWQARYVKQNTPVNMGEKIFAVANGCIAPAKVNRVSPLIRPYPFPTPAPDDLNGEYYTVECDSNSAKTGKLIKKHCNTSVSSSGSSFCTPACTSPVLGSFYVIGNIIRYASNIR